MSGDSNNMYTDMDMDISVNWYIIYIYLPVYSLMLLLYSKKI